MRRSLGGMLRRFTLKRVVGAAAGCGGLVCAQAVYCQATYVPMRDPNDRVVCGIEHWEDLDEEGGGHRRDDGDMGGWGAREGRRRRNVLIVGDSLVVGIGCKEKPVLPQVLSRSLANALKVDVSWRAIGVNGGDMKTIHANVLETVRRFQDEQAARIKAAEERAASHQPSLEQPPPHTPAAEHSNAALAATTTLVARTSASLPVVKLKILEHLQHKPPQVQLAGAALFDFVSSSVRRRVAEAGGELVPFAPPAAESVGVDAVVVMVGLNDFKKILRGSTSPGIFRTDIESFLRDMREQVGPECMVVFPGLPCEVMMLPEPLKTVATHVAGFYDEEKRRMAAHQALVHFIPKPAFEMWTRAAERYGEVVAQDGVHPNEIGYKVFAEYVGGELARIWKEQAEKVREGRLEGADLARVRGGGWREAGGDLTSSWGGSAHPTRAVSHAGAPPETTLPVDAVST